MMRGIFNIFKSTGALRAVLLAVLTACLIPTAWGGEITGPTEVFEDIPHVWKTTIKPTMPALEHKNLLYTWRFKGPGGTFFCTGSRPSTHPVSWDTPSDPEKNQIRVILTYTCVVPNPELTPPTIEIPGLPVTAKLDVLVKDRTAPGEDGSTAVTGLTDNTPITGSCGEPARQNITVRVKDNNPNVGPNPGGAYVKLYYQVGPHEWYGVKREDGEIVWDRKAGTYPCNETYSDVTGGPERRYSYLKGSTPEGEVKIFSKTSPYSPDPYEASSGSPENGWPDAGYWWVGPLYMEYQGVVDQGRKHSTTQWFLPADRLLMPLHFAVTSTDWQPLKMFIEVRDASGNTWGYDYKHAASANKKSRMTNTIEVTDDKYPWMTVRMKDFRSHTSREFSLYMNPWNIFYNLDDEWTAEDDYRWPPPDGRNSFLEPLGTFFQEDVRIMFHVFACDNIDMTDPDVLYDQQDLDHLSGLKEESLLFQVYRQLENGEWGEAMPPVEGKNDFLVEEVFSVAATYVVRFQAEDLAGNLRVMYVDLPLTDTAIRHDSLQFDHR